jgi:putative ABC transport system ATP-binding protein
VSTSRLEAGELVILRGRGSTRPRVDGGAACHADAVSKVFGDRHTAVHALRDVTLDIPRSSFTAIMGPSGSGKSTLLHCLAALDTPTAGRVFLGGTELTALSRRQQAQVRRDRIGFVFQSFNLVPTLDAFENITLPQRLAGRRPDDAWLEHVITRIGLRDRLHHRPSELSGGQQQRIALARALAGRPDVIFADEPTGNLDTTASREMLTLLRDAVDQFDQTVVTVTHDPAVARYADQILYFSDGQVIERDHRPEAERAPEPLRQHDAGDRGADVGRARRARRRSDGQQTMRSRRRRQANEPTPGRPMVGSDDEVEVARQERWLQRIREQFEAEDGGDADGAFGAETFAQPNDTDAFGDHTTGDARSDDASDRGRTEPPTTHDPYHTDTGRTQPPTTHEPNFANTFRAAHDPGAGHWRTTADRHQVDDVGPHGVGDGEGGGWLPAERSWRPATDEATTTADDWRVETANRAELTPWSRPEIEATTEPERNRPTSMSDLHDTSDRWAPAEQRMAEEYHSEHTNGRRGRGRQHERDGWTGRGSESAQRPPSRGADVPERDDRREREHHAEPEPVERRYTDPHHVEPQALEYDTAPWNDARTPRWRLHGAPDDIDLPNAAVDDGGVEPPVDPTSNGQHRNGQHADHTSASDDDVAQDPWVSLWDANTGLDVSEVWTPSFDHSWPSNGNGHANGDLHTNGRSRSNSFVHAPYPTVDDSASASSHHQRREQEPRQDADTRADDDGATDPRIPPVDHPPQPAPPAADQRPPARVDKADRRSQPNADADDTAPPVTDGPTGGLTAERGDQVTAHDTRPPDPVRPAQPVDDAPDATAAAADHHGATAHHLDRDRRDARASNAPIDHRDAPASDAPIDHRDAPASDAPIDHRDAPASDAPTDHRDAPASDAPTDHRDAPASDAPTDHRDAPASDARTIHRDTSTDDVKADDHDAVTDDADADRHDAPSDDPQAPGRRSPADEPAEPTAEAPNAHDTTPPAGATDDHGHDRTTGPGVVEPPAHAWRVDTRTEQPERGWRRREPAAAATTARATPQGRRDTPVPPPLASLRNTRRPDQAHDPMEALQLLQEQLDRLSSTSRRKGRRQRPPRPGDVDRRERF